VGLLDLRATGMPSEIRRPSPAAARPPPPAGEGGAESTSQLVTFIATGSQPISLLSYRLVLHSNAGAAARKPKTASS